VTLNGYRKQAVWEFIMLNYISVIHFHDDIMRHDKRYT